MDASLSMKALKNLFSFPFQESGWQSKVMIGSGLIFASSFIPVLPWLPVLGYSARLMRVIVLGDGRLRLPDWDDWGGLFGDGMRMAVIALILLLPPLLVMLLGLGAYFGSFFGMIASGAENSNNIGPFALLIPLGIIVLLITQFISMLLSFIAGVLIPPSQAHAASTRSLASFFNMGWWRVLSANPGGFILAASVLWSMLTLMYSVLALLYMSLLLCFALPFVVAVLSFYILMVSAALGAQAYREGQETLASHQPAAP